MSTPVLAFYHGRGRALDRMVRIWTRSRFSHVELCLMPGPAPHVRRRIGRFNAGLRDGGLSMLAVSASWRDGGVRERWITFDAARWTLMQAPRHPRGEDPMDRARRAMGMPYAWGRLARTQLLGLSPGPRRGWFCSELVADALGMDRPWTLSPGGLARRMEARHGAVRDPR